MEIKGEADISERKVACLDSSVLFRGSSLGLGCS